MPIKNRQQLKSVFQDGDTPQETNFVDLIDSSLARKGYLDFTGRYYFYTDNRWIGTNPAYGQATENYNYTHGTAATPNIRWDSLGIGFLPKGTILHGIECIGRVNSTQVEKIEVQLSVQGNDFDNGGFNSIANSENQVVLSPTVLESSASNLTYFHRQSIDLGNYVLGKDRIIEFCCRPLGTLTGTRYWTAQRKLIYTIPE